MNSDSGGWKNKETVQGTLRSAKEHAVNDEEIISHFEHQRSGISGRQIRAILDAGVPDYGESVDYPYRERTDEEPRATVSRYFDDDDASYVSDRELARVVAAGLQRVEGNARVKGGDSLAVDVLWNRSHTTTALRTVSCTRGEEVSESVIRETLDGEVTPESGRAPSTIAVATNGGFTEGATQAAAGEDLHLVDVGQLQRWFSIFQLTPDLYGPILEQGELVEIDTDELLEDAPELPTHLRNVDLFDLSDGYLPPEKEPTFSTQAENPQLSEGSSTPRKTKSGNPDQESAPTSRRKTSEGIPAPDVGPGEYGKLYADPDEDGDYDAIDTLLENMEDE